MSNKQLLALMGLCGALALTTPAQACNTIKPEAVLNADPVRAGHIAELDARLNGAQRDYEQGKITDAQLYNQYLFIDGKGPAQDDQYQAWIQQYPKSYAAHLATGIYYMRAGQNARGCEFADKTPQSSVDAMQAYMLKAEEELQKSLAMTTKPLMTAVSLIEEEQFTNNPNQALYILEAANAIAPDNLVARRQFMYLLARRWYGDAHLAYAFLHEAKAAGLSQAKLDVLESLIHYDIGRDLAGDNKFQQALDQLKKAESLVAPHPELMSSDDYVGLWVEMAWCYKQLDSYEDTIRYADRGLKINPYNDSLLNSRVYALIQLNRTQEAIPNILLLADQGDDWAQREVAYLRDTGALGPATKP